MIREYHLPIAEGSKITPIRTKEIAKYGSVSLCYAYEPKKRKPSHYVIVYADKAVRLCDTEKDAQQFLFDAFKTEEGIERECLAQMKNVKVL